MVFGFGRVVLGDLRQLLLGREDRLELIFCGFGFIHPGGFPCNRSIPDGYDLLFCDHHNASLCSPDDTGPREASFSAKNKNP